MSQSNVIIKGVKANGKPFEYVFNTQDVNLNLSGKKLKSIDLTPLEKCSNLRILDLKNNQLESIDLTPITNCSKLLDVYLRKNSLLTVDLTPLENKKKLNHLGLSNNKLVSVDLSPLQTCDNLKSLGLSNNELTSLDLTPIQNLTKLNVFTLNNNKFTTLDLTPIEHLFKNMLIFNVDKVADAKGVLKPILTDDQKRYFNRKLVQVLLTMITSIFGFIFALNYFFKKRNEKAKWFVFGGLTSLISIGVIASGIIFGSNARGIVSIVGSGALVWLLGLIFTWNGITRDDMKK
jgi:hypothetical protein